MAKKKQEKTQEKIKSNEAKKAPLKESKWKNIFTLTSKTNGELWQFIIGLLIGILAIYMLMSMISFISTGAADHSYIESGEGNVQNASGSLGVRLANWLMNGCFGYPSFFIVVFMIVAGLRLMRAYQIKLGKWFLCCSLLMVWSSVLLGYIFSLVSYDGHIYPGGLHGANVSAWLDGLIGFPGVCLLLLVVAIFFAIYLSRETMEVIRRILHPDISLDRWKKKDDEQNDNHSDDDTEELPSEDDNLCQNELIEERATVINLDIDNIEKTEAEEEESLSDNHAESLTDDQETEEIPLTVKPSEEGNEEVEMEIEQPEDDIYEGPQLEPYNPKLDLENYRYPTLDLMKKYENNVMPVDTTELNANKERIIEVLRNFGVEIASISATVGPTITLYEITPAAGVRIAKIRNLENDIALSLAALGIRIIAPIPGKGTIGIEVPNARPRIVSMESILASKKFQECDMELPVAVGKTISNEVYMFDLAKAPHLLVAGATGMGKSVGLNAIVTSLLYKKHPAELKFVIIDPKKVEFSIYAPIENHFLAKLPDSGDAIITDVTKVVQTLNSLCVEMDTRYDLLKSAGARNIKEYNAKFIARRLNPEKGHKYLPYIVVIVDEFGDLIMTAGKEVELPIARIAQLARAVGIHMIIATQRPTTNIITGTIKANFPARMAFRVASMIDSRTILDRPGANQLIGKGDMLYLQGQDPVRVQCAFVDTPEVENVVHHICTQQSYLSAFMLPEVQIEGGDNGSAADVDMNKLDPMLRDAAQLIIIHQQGSTSLIQRKFSIGYNRAGRIMDQLERIGVVGPAQGSKPRDVLVQTEMDLEMIMSNL